MAIQLYEEIPAVCKNPDCEDIGAFVLYDVDEIVIGEDKKEYVICYECKCKIYID